MTFERFLNESAKKIIYQILNEYGGYGSSGGCGGGKRRTAYDDYIHRFNNDSVFHDSEVKKSREFSEWLKNHPDHSEPEFPELMDANGYTDDENFDPKECDFFTAGRPYAKFVKSETGTKYDRDITTLRRELANMHKQLRAAAKTWPDGCNILHGNDLLNVLKKYNVKIDPKAKEFISQELTLPWNGPHGSLKIANTLMQLLPKIENLAIKQ